MPLLTRNRLLTLLGLAAASAVVYYARFIEPDWLYVRYIQLTLPRLPREFHDFRLAHISDIHMGGWMTRQRLMETITVINRIQPDAAAITGDFVDKHYHSVQQDLIESLRQLKPLTVCVMGNHDYYHGINTVRRVVAGSGIIDLSNSVHTLQRGDAQLHLAGVDDLVLRKQALDRVLAKLPETGAAVLLAHEPDFADVSAATGRFEAAGLRLADFAIAWQTLSQRAVHRWGYVPVYQPGSGDDRAVYAFWRAPGINDPDSGKLPALRSARQKGRL
jgi:predicted MPP superfamily phosphohydrolase